MCVGTCRVSSIVERRFYTAKARGASPLPGTRFMKKKKVLKTCNLYTVDDGINRPVPSPIDLGKVAEWMDRDTSDDSSAWAQALGGEHDNDGAGIGINRGDDDDNDGAGIGVNRS